MLKACCGLRQGGSRIPSQCCPKGSNSSSPKKGTLPPSEQGLRGGLGCPWDPWGWANRLDSDQSWLLPQQEMGAGGEQIAQMVPCLYRSAQMLPAAETPCNIPLSTALPATASSQSPTLPFLPRIPTLPPKHHTSSPLPILTPCRPLCPEPH